MMTNAWDISQWKTCENKAYHIGLEIIFSGEKFLIKGSSCGIFLTVNDLYNFLCGYESGYAHARIDAVMDMEPDKIGNELDKNNPIPEPV
jgi:hypothetical protein